MGGGGWAAAGGSGGGAVNRRYGASQMHAKFSLLLIRRVEHPTCAAEESSGLPPPCEKLHPSRSLPRLMNVSTIDTTTSSRRRAGIGLRGGPGDTRIEPGLGFRLLSDDHTEVSIRDLSTELKSNCTLICKRLHTLSCNRTGV